MPRNLDGEIHAITNNRHTCTYTTITNTKSKKKPKPVTAAKRLHLLSEPALRCLCTTQALESNVRKYSSYPKNNSAVKKGEVKKVQVTE